MATGPLGDPCTPYGGNCLNELLDLTGQYGRTVGFGFYSDTCVGAGLHTDLNEVPMVPPLCTITASGMLTGYCGRAQGSGTGTVTLWVPLLERAETFPFLWHLVWAGTQYMYSEMLLQGTIGSPDGRTGGWILGRLGITPDPAGGSCTDVSATGWIARGDWAFEIWTL